MTEMDKIQEFTTKIYEGSSEIKVLQEKLEDMLSAIDKNNLDYNRGKLPKEIFQAEDNKLRKEGAQLVKSINNLVNDILNYIKAIAEETNKIKRRKIEKKRKSKRTSEKKIDNIVKLDMGGSIYHFSSPEKELAMGR